jgi:hypothetical protein
MDRKLDLRLKEIRGRISQADPLLVLLLNVAVGTEAQIQFGLVLVLDGMTVMGVPGPSASTGEVLDRQSARFFRSMQAISMSTGGDGEVWSQLIDWVKETSPFLSQAKNDDEAHSKVHEKVGDVEIDDWADLLDRDDNLAEEAAKAFTPPKAFTLTNAQIRPVNGDTWESIPNMRVNLSSVRAWWTFDLGVPEEAQEILASLEKNAENEH